MKTLVLIRVETSDQGTIGILLDREFLLCYTIELPWRDNKRNISCIPTGEYQVVPYTSRKFGRVFHVLDVPNRSGILIHSGNVAGDKNKGYKTHSYGCILPGRKTGYLWKQRAVLISRPSVVELREKFNEPFKLKIVSLCGKMDV